MYRSRTPASVWALRWIVKANETKKNVQDKEKIEVIN
jgi:hypothetical protein